MSVTYVQSQGRKVSTGTSRVIQADVASFADIVQWYSDRLGGSEIPEALVTFNQLAKAEQHSREGISRDLAAILSTHLTYKFTSVQKQITILHAESSGDLVAIVLLGTEHETSIQILRRCMNPTGD
ncbi:hypothetical protein NHH03_14220 [Stieleria sp. TO1_6]|nr:hypothetical protein [Stieleria tagensis]